MASIHSLSTHQTLRRAARSHRGVLSLQHERQAAVVLRPGPHRDRSLHCISFSRGARVGPAPAPVWSYVAPKSTDVKSGAAIYSAQCAVCHGSNGAGNATADFPPLWGPTSFNDRAGMDRLMPGFVHANMPLGHAGTLTDQQSADVSAYILSKPRPHLQPASIEEPLAVRAEVSRIVSA